MSDKNELELFLTKDVKDLLDFIFDGIYVVDTDRKIVFWNKGAENMTGYKQDKVRGRKCSDNILNHIDCDGNLVCLCDTCPLKRAVEMDKESIYKLYPLHNDGHRFPVSTHISPVKNKEGKIIGAIEVFRDISEQEKLDALQKKFDKLVRQYISVSTYDSIIKEVSSGGKIKGVLKDMTVFFMDIVSFTTFSEKHKPEQVIEMLNYFFSVSTHVIKNNTGDIDKFIGDCVMAIFIDASDAVKAAKEFINEGLPSLNEMLKQKGLQNINVRIGINSGNLIQGDIGSDARKDMTVIGDVVNTASRVEHEARHGSFMISESTYSRLPNPHDFEFDKEILLKGKAIPVKLFRPK
ncbi:MAG TPA: adenylate/guanylate cyclase domain-containing protein [Candidatus Wallbacteria bacterium]|nr:adenylate/guanylate cyclase domain-containing protein [Candidatus Wallbacteria bacterium]